MRTSIWKLLVLTAMACGGVPPGTPDGAGVADAPRADAPPPDAMGPPPPDRFSFTATGRLTGGAWTMEASVGDPMSQATTAGGANTCAGASPAL